VICWFSKLDCTLCVALAAGFLDVSGSCHIIVILQYLKDYLELFLCLIPYVTGH